ncbi:MAG: M28 family peptidase [Candidatus Izemoplasmatales bacterium]|nr:M28 family peptidase [Candidatus Izemoplasmatales bacterium]
MKSRFRFSLVVVLLSLLASLFVLLTPIPEPISDDFSAVSAAAYIQQIALEPHSVFDEEAHETVRLYLKDQLTELLGAQNVREIDYTADEVGSDYPIRNLLGVIPGTSDTAIMLVAHYDSRGHIGRMGELGGSYGAADDGYGVATILELARVYADRTDLENTIMFLITDGEETGLYGAEMVTQNEQELMDQVGFVINLEARGIEGPAYMFETSKNNEKIIDFYRNASYPVSYSIATAVYTVMPNMTDFTEFLAIGKQGINFAVLDSLYYYHTPRDNFTNIDLSSLQHYGAQVAPLVEEFATNAVYSDVHYFEGEQDQVFFTLFPNVFVSYTDTVATVLHVLVLLGVIAFLIFGIVQKKIKPLAVLKQFGMILLSLVVVGIAGVYLSKLIAFLGRTSWSLTYVRMENTELPTLFLMVGTLLGLFFLYRRFVEKNQEQKEFLFAASLFLALLAFLTGVVLSGASFLFFVPSLFGLIYLIFQQFNAKMLWKRILFVVSTLILMLIAVPLLYSLFLALTVGGLAALFAIMLFYLIVLIPIFVNEAYSM